MFGCGPSAGPTNRRWQTIHLMACPALVAAGCDTKPAATPADVTVNNDGLSVTVSYPPEGMVATGSVTARAVVAAKKQVVEVLFFLDGIKKHSDTSSPYEAQLDLASLASGSTHTITAVAKDKDGNTGVSVAVRVVISAACLKDSDCTSTSCFQNVCRMPCTSAKQCLSGNTCMKVLTDSSSWMRLCVPRTRIPCIADSNCTPGYCYQNVCHEWCSSTLDCDVGRVCKAVSTAGGASEKLCVTPQKMSMSCSLTSNCPGGYYCHKYACRAYCSSTVECVSGQVCQKVKTMAEQRE